MESVLARSLALAGRTAEAEESLRRLRELNLSPYRLETIELALGQINAQKDFTLAIGQLFVGQVLHGETIYSIAVGSAILREAMRTGSPRTTLSYYQLPGTASKPSTF